MKPKFDTPVGAHGGAPNGYQVKPYSSPGVQSPWLNRFGKPAESRLKVTELVFSAIFQVAFEVQPDGFQRPATPTEALFLKQSFRAFAPLRLCVMLLVMSPRVTS
ncbi:MAG: hypothetical protein HZC41_03420 [Chloroflexi bacterium]|nr:hypothetical protein [Chloroflexota bacterium]